MEGGGGKDDVLKHLMRSNAAARRRQGCEKLQLEAENTRKEEETQRETTRETEQGVSTGKIYIRSVVGANPLKNPKKHGL